VTEDEGEDVDTLALTRKNVTANIAKRFQAIPLTE
jgi:hypothetical protein